MDEEAKQNSKPNLHAALYGSFFLLRTEVVINGQQALIVPDGEGWLTLNCRYPEVGVSFDSLVTDVNEIMYRHGMKAVIECLYGEVPLFKIKVTSKKDLEKLVSLERKIKRDLASRIAAHMTAELDHSASPSSLHVQVEPQVYLLIPDYVTKDVKIIRVTKDNVPLCMALFQESKVFDFDAAFRASRINSTMEDRGKNECQINIRNHALYHNRSKGFTRASA